jgi:TfoX/Sxy family transcriptional regulator of competence genes
MEGDTARVAYDQHLAERIRWVLVDEGVTEREMFGGIAFMLHGNMVCGVTGDTLMLRLGPELSVAALDEPHTRPMDFTGRPMRSIVLVEQPAVETEDALADWVDRARTFVATLPPK